MFLQQLNLKLHICLMTILAINICIIHAAISMTVHSSTHTNLFAMILYCSLSMLGQCPSPLHLLHECLLLLLLALILRSGENSTGELKVLH